jgi:AraC family transcriptional regulator, positive regulator of tynA and feaB
LDLRHANAGNREASSSAFVLSTAGIPAGERLEWLRETIRREYADVEITPPADGNLFNEMTISPWRDLRLSAIRSHAIGIERLPREACYISQDSYFAVVPLAGDYLLEQGGREACLQPGDIALYDATRLHRIHCPKNFAKLLVSIPRVMLRNRMAGVEHCTAARIPGDNGIGAVASSFIRAAALNRGTINTEEFSSLAEHFLDLLTLALASVRPQDIALSRSRAISLQRVKDFVESRLADPALDTALTAAAAGLSPRYINELFRGEDTSLMRHVWRRRLERCRKDLLEPRLAAHSISEIALRWGFSDLAHFSRSFRRQFGCAPKELREALNRP